MKPYFQGIISKCPSNDVLVAPGPSFLHMAETGDGEFQPEENTANAARIRDTWNACLGLDLPENVPAGIIADLVTRAGDMISALDAGRLADSADAAQSLRAILARLAG